MNVSKKAPFRPWTVLVFAVAVGGCADRESRAAAAGSAGDSTVAPPQVCQVDQANRPLPPELRETSGLARSTRDSGLLWTHNDSGNRPELFTFDGHGKIAQRVRIVGADMNDWEDMEPVRCGNRSCLMLADIGDNLGRREQIAIFRVEEPAAGATEARATLAVAARYPDGPRNAEALFVDPSGTLFIVSKGTREAIALYRVPKPGRADDVVTLERVRELFPRPFNPYDVVTAATSTPDGRWVGIRTYRTLYLYRTAELLGSGNIEPVVVDLSSVGEQQGEAIALADDGVAWLTSEAEQTGFPTWSRLRCQLP